VYQPIVELVTGLTVGVEALVRWEHPERGLLLPADFMPIAEESGAIRELGAWALRTAISDASRWPERFDRPAGFIAVNLSPAQLGHADLVDVMSSALADSAMDPQRVMVEVEEGAAIDETGAVSGVLGSLRRLGIAIAIDRVGVGSSSLVGLHRLRPVHLKIDRSIVTGLEEPDADHAVVSALVELSRALGLRTVAVGVESDAVREALLELGCDLGQGNLWLPPSEALALRAWLRAH
jgi:EAL domain-containing protein (putative c-di-GMP-specific phosphodiesterase class I)